MLKLYSNYKKQYKYNINLKHNLLTNSTNKVINHIFTHINIIKIKLFIKYLKLKNKA